MKTRLKLSLAAAFAIGLALSCPVSSTAQTIAEPVVLMNVDGKIFDLTHNIQFNPDGLTFYMPTQTLTNPLTGKSVTVKIDGDTDPFVNFSFSATNPLSVPDTFGAFFGINGITDCPAGSIVTSSISYSLTTGRGPVSVTPVSPNLGTGDPFINGVSTGLAHQIGPSASFSGSGSTQFGPPTAGFTNSFISPVAINQLGILLSFNLSGGLSQAGITGRIECIAPAVVPEPGTFALLVGGGMPLGLLAVRRLRRRA